jgi:hypothetical protein
MNILRASSFDCAQDEETWVMALRKPPHPERRRRAHSAYPALQRDTGRSSTRLAGHGLSARAESPLAITLYHLFGEQFHRLEWNRTIPFKPVLL